MTTNVHQDVAHQGVIQSPRQAGQNQETARFTRGIHKARALAHARRQAEAVDAKASGIVRVNERPHVICEVDVSRSSEERIEAALAYGSQYGAELTFVWVFDPRAFASTAPVAAGGIGTWGLPLLLGRIVERARARGLTASSVVLIGARDQVLDEEQLADADALYTTDQQVVRCHRCGWRHDPRGIHFCPTEHLPRASHPAA
jgi:hypothetical protein